MTRMQKNISKNRDPGSSTDVGSHEMSSMMTNLDATNQQLTNLQEKLDRARNQAITNDEKISDLKTKHDKLVMVAQNYKVDHHRTKEYINATKVVKVAPDRVQAEAEQKLARMQEKFAQVDYKNDEAKERFEQLLAKKEEMMKGINAKKERLHGLLGESKDAQNKALSMARIIRADKDSFSKLGNLQTTSNRGQAALQGWQPENAKSLQYSQVKAANSRRNNGSTIH